jgi:hypothetical protein
MPSVRNHSPATAAVSRAGFSAPETAGENDPLADLIRQSDRAVALLLEMEADPQRQAVLEELAEQSDRAATLLAQRQEWASLPDHGGTP